MIKELHSLKKVMSLMPDQAASFLDDIIQKNVPVMEITDIREKTKSKTISTRSCVYEATIDTVGIGDPDGDSDTLNSKFYDVAKGDQMCIAGCGAQDKRGNSYYLYGDIWILIANENMIHVANPLLVAVPVGHPVINVIG